MTTCFPGSVRQIVQASASFVRALIVLLAAAPGLTASSALLPVELGDRTVHVSNGQQFARAFANFLNTVEIVLDDSITLSEADWQGLDIPILLDRNITVFGNPALVAVGDLPALNGSFVKNKLQLAPGTVLNLTGIVLTWYREDMPSSTPGMDLLTSSNYSANSTVPPPLLVWHKIALNNRLCFPLDMSIKSANATKRPDGIPGQQLMTFDMPQPGCHNESSGPWLTRCYAAHRRYDDLGAYGAVYGPSGAYERTGYLVRAWDTDLLCSGVMTYDCIEKYGGTTLACYYSVFPRNKYSSSSTPPPTTVAEQQQQPGAAPEVLLIAVLCPVLGCAVIAAAVLFFVRWRRRRRLLGDQGTRQQPDNELAPLDVEERGAPQRKGADSRRKSYQGPDGMGVRLANDSGSSDVTSGGGAQQPEPQQTITLDVLAPPDNVSGGAGQAGPPTFAQTNTELAAYDDHPLGKARGSAQQLRPSTPVVGFENPVTLNTPPREDVQLLVGAETLDDKEVKLLRNATRGVGSFGQVVEGIYQSQRVAVKLVAEAYQWAGPSESLLRSFAQEVEVLCRCQHPNVVRLLAACLTPPRICLVMELMETSLEKLLYPPARRSSGGDHRLSLTTVLNVAVEVAKGLEYLHPTIMHRDLKPANVLINDPTNIRPVVKLTDFGLSRLRSTEAPTLTPSAGTPAYLAPEGLDPTNAVITHKADIYSLAVMLWEMLAGERPWSGCNMMDVAIQVALMGNRPPLECIPAERCPPKLRALIERCWQTDPRRRPAAAEVVKSLVLIQQEVEMGAEVALGAAAAAAAGSALAPPSPVPPAVRGAVLAADFPKRSEAPIGNGTELGDGGASASSAAATDAPPDNGGREAGGAAAPEQQLAVKSADGDGRDARVLQQQANSSTVAAIAAANNRVAPETLEYSNDTPEGLSDSGLPGPSGGACVVLKADPQPEREAPVPAPRLMPKVVPIQLFAGRKAIQPRFVAAVGEPQKLSEFGGVVSYSEGEDHAKARTVGFLSSLATDTWHGQENAQQRSASSAGNPVSSGGGLTMQATLASIPEMEPCASPAAAATGASASQAASGRTNPP